MQRFFCEMADLYDHRIYMSESEYMPWNAMVGITRSKAFVHGISWILNDFYWRYNGDIMDQKFENGGLTTNRATLIGIKVADTDWRSCSRDGVAQLPTRNFERKSAWWFQLSGGCLTNINEMGWNQHARQPLVFPFLVGFVLWRCVFFLYFCKFRGLASFFPWIHSRSCSFLIFI